MNNKKIYKYLIRTFLISWISWGILALLVNFNVFTFSSVLGTIIFTIGGFGPTIAAISLLEDKITVKAISNFIFSHKRKTFRYLLLFTILEIIVIGLSSMEINPSIPIFTVPIILLQAIVIAGGNEELGWRGTMQPNLEKKFAFPIATIITGITWSIWHLPLWFINGTTQQNMSFISFAILAIFISFWLACVYKKTNSVFYCSILHGISNVLLSLFIIKTNWILITGLIIMSIISIILYYKSDLKTKSI